MAFLLALGLTLYPVISNYVNQKYASQIHTAYQKVMEQEDDSDPVFSKRRSLPTNIIAPLSPEQRMPTARIAYWQQRQTMTAISISPGTALWAM